MTSEQKFVGAGVASGVLTMIASVASIFQLLPINSGLVDMGSRLAYALQMNVFASAPGDSHPEQMDSFAGPRNQTFKGLQRCRPF